MKATLRRVALVTILWALFVTPVQADESGIWLDNFWSDGPVSVFLYEQPTAGLESSGFYARHDLRPGQVVDIDVSGRGTVWADVRVMHADGQQWLLSSENCGYRGAFAVRPGQTIEISYEQSEGYADSSTGLKCRVKSGSPNGR